MIFQKSSVTEACHLSRPSYNYNLTIHSIPWIYSQMDKYATDFGPDRELLKKLLSALILFTHYRLNLLDA